MADQERASVEWRKSEASADGGCVEVAITDSGVLVRQSKDPSGPVLEFAYHEWTAFLVGARGGAFDLPETSQTA